MKAVGFPDKRKAKIIPLVGGGIGAVAAPQGPAVVAVVLKSRIGVDLGDVGGSGDGPDSMKDCVGVETTARLVRTGCTEGGRLGPSGQEKRAPCRDLGTRRWRLRSGGARFRTGRNGA
jgi:hypothetical protein